MFEVSSASAQLSAETLVLSLLSLSSLYIHKVKLKVPKDPTVGTSLTRRCRQVELRLIHFLIPKNLKSKLSRSEQNLLVSYSRSPSSVAASLLQSSPAISSSSPHNTHKSSNEVQYFQLTPTREKLALLSVGTHRYSGQLR